TRSITPRSAAMDDLEDELDLRFHKGLEADVYYRCPALESLDGAIRNELDKNASSLIPTDIVTEFIFAATSTLTIPVTQQPNLDVLIEPADFLQSITVQHALCHHLDSKDRLKPQRAVARSIIQALEEADGHEYIERSASNTKSSDGARFRYVCRDSPQSRSRRKPAKSHESDDGHGNAKIKDAPPTYDCGGVIHIKFSIKREAINVVYKHNPICTHVEKIDSIPTAPTTDGASTQGPAEYATNGNKKWKRKSKQKEPVAVMDDYHDQEMDMSTSPEAPRSSTKKPRKKTGASAPIETTLKASTRKSKKLKGALSSPSSRKRAVQREPSSLPRLPKEQACIRCRENKIKCDEAKPTCSQCRRGLWTCQYETAGKSKRSKSGCINCKQRRRKCTEEKPYCAYCSRIGDDCEYSSHS
ncbi:hypothetical protein J1614_008404, partial [Plenodomus biglobosus]